MTEWIAVLAGAISLAGLTMAADSQPVPPPLLGVNIHFTDAKPGEMEMIRAAGVNIVRMDLIWANVEKQQGVYDFSRYDRLVTDLEANGIQALFILDYGNPLYDDNLSPHTDEGRSAFARFAAAAVKRYAGRGIFWEIWNEPNIGQFWKPQPDAADYVKLVIAAAKAMREAAPNEKIIGPASSTIDLPFLEACFKGGVLEYFDGVSVHPYRSTGPETVTDEYRKLRRLIARYAPAGKQIPVLSGEWGYSNARREIDVELQGKYLARQWLVNLASDIPLSIWYDWHDDGPDEKEAEHHFGTVMFPYHPDGDAPYQAKPAYLAATTLTRELNGYRFNKRLALERESDWLLLFQNEDAVKLVCWTTDVRPHLTKLPIPQGSFTATSHLGVSRGEVQTTAGDLLIELSDGPLYLTPTRPDDWLALLAHWSRLEDQVAFRAPGTLAMRSVFRNTTPTAMLVKNPGGMSTVSPGAAQVIQQDWYVPRTPHLFKVDSVLEIAGRPTVRQEAYVGAANPMNVELRPAAARKLMVLVENPSGEALEGEVSIGVGDAVPISFAAGETWRTVEFPIDPDASASYAVHPVIRGGGRLLLELPARRYMPFPAELQELAAHPDGDAAVGSEMALSTAPAGTDAPIADAPALRLTYRFEDGWKFARVATPQPLEIAGKPVALGFWVKGDRSGNLVRLRYVDSTGQVHQPHGFVLDFAEWRYLEFPMRGEGSGHWAGANDGVVHYPIRLDTLFLVDSAKRKATNGAILVSGPVLVYPDR